MDLNENENSAKETGYSCRRLRHIAGWASDIASARETDPVLAKALDPSFSECSSHGNNVVLMTREAASKLALPNPNFVRVLGLKPVMVASPDVPFPLPTPGSLFYAPLVALAERVGGSDPARMQVQVSVGDVLRSPGLTPQEGMTAFVRVGLILSFDLFRIIVLDRRLKRAFQRTHQVHFFFSARRGKMSFEKKTLRIRATSESSMTGLHSRRQTAAPLGSSTTRRRIGGQPFIFSRRSFF